MKIIKHKYDENNKTCIYAMNLAIHITIMIFFFQLEKKKAIAIKIPGMLNSNITWPQRVQGCPTPSERRLT